MPRRPLIVLAALLPLGLAPRAGAQRDAALPSAAVAVPRPADAPAPGRVAGAGAFGWAVAIPRSAAPLASLVVPGLGQATLGRDRFVAYLALEAFTLLQYGKDAREGARERRRYRGLARDVARASFGGARPNGSWDYYESMERYLESGQFSLSASVVVPEVDTLTYNGSRWLLARRTFWSDPLAPPPVTSEAYQRAVDFYLEKAVRPEFRWSWRNAQLQLDLYRRSIARANDSARRARSAITVLVANHLLSAIDAFAVLRVESDARAGTHRLGVAIPLGR